MLGNRTSLKADAILFAISKIGVMAIECIASLGLKIPDDVALVSFDNADAYKICISPVTVVGQPRLNTELEINTHMFQSFNSLTYSKRGYC